MFSVYTSNRLESLVQALAEVVKVPLANPLEREVIVVQSKGMERWLSMQLAQKLTIWANGDFPFPEAMLWRIFKNVLRNLPETSPFEDKILLWSILAILPNLLTLPEFAEIATYLQNDQQGIKQFQLATKLATLFDQYTVYRPKWVLDWEKGEQPLKLADQRRAHWQATLWQELIKRHGSHHRARIREEFFKHLGKNPSRLPQRISLFGIPALPPFHLEVFARLGQWTEVHFFLINPCQEHWRYIFTEAEIARKVRLTGVSAETLHLTTGNSLLASMGKVGRDFIDMIEDYPEHLSIESFIEPSENSLLACIQSDILKLRERDNMEQKTQISLKDRSLQIHACHSRMREIEVLHDQLLAKFAEDPTLLPKDILVMAPDIEEYAPFIQAVFATTVIAGQYIPFSISDRSLRYESVVVDTFLAILELRHKRLTNNEILKILEVSAVQERFKLVKTDLEFIEHWIKKTNIRWGKEGNSKKQFNLPTFEENTWYAGIKRLLLGYALPGQETRLFVDILPFDDLEGQQTLILGKWITFLENIFNTIDELKKPRTLSEWASFLGNLLETFFIVNETTEFQILQFRTLLSELEKQGQQANFDKVINSDIVYQYLRGYAEHEPATTPFLTGHVTFCTLLPMRSIPFKVICLLGMNDKTYPRTSSAIGFDLMTQYPRVGDRSRRQNDRYLFLEALLSARQCFYMSYIGHNIRDNSVQPPSVLVRELQDYLQKGFEFQQGEILEILVTYHPLQAFSPRYFQKNEGQLFSYSDEYCVASHQLLKPHIPLVLFMGETLPEPPNEWKTIEVEDLVSFFKNPVKFLLRKRLNLYLPKSDELFEETEPFVLKGLENYLINQTLVEKSLSGFNLKEYYSIMKAQGHLPHGPVGEYLYQQRCKEIAPFIEEVRQAIQQVRLPSEPFDLVVGNFRLVGYLHSLWQDHLIHYRYAVPKVKDHLQLWINHLVLNTLAKSTLPHCSLLLLQNEKYYYPPVTNSLQFLQELLEIYWYGLRKPLPFFPESSLSYITELKETHLNKKALERALATWQGTGYQTKGQNWGESQDDYYQLCFKNIEDTTSLFDQEFERLAQQILMPLLGNMTVEKF